MSLKLGTEDIAGISQNTKYNAHSLFDFKWSDHVINDMNWLEADTWSWHSGDTYTNAYNHLVQDIQGITSETETIGGYTVTFYRATDGHKIVLADSASAANVNRIYRNLRVAWYYILDTTNRQFKLPRTQYGFKGIRESYKAGDYINESLPNIKGEFGTGRIYTTVDFTTGIVKPFIKASIVSNTAANTGSGSSASITGFDASLSNSTYQDDAPVQERATQMYLYFYVGEYSQTAIEQTAGLNAELFNGKADVDLSNIPASKGILIESYVNDTSWYRVYSDGWCEQGGRISIASMQYGASSVSLLKPFNGTDYTITIGGRNLTNNGNPCFAVGNSVTDNSFNIWMERSTGSNHANQSYWLACGYIS